MMRLLRIGRRSRIEDLFSPGVITLVLLMAPDVGSAKETFVTIHKVSGSRIEVTKDAAGTGGGRGRGMRGGGTGANGNQQSQPGFGGRRRGRGMRGGSSNDASSGFRARGSGRGMRGGNNQQGSQRGSSGGRGLGRRRFGRGGASASSAKTTTITVPTDARITSAMRERRTFEFRALDEISGGLRNRIFTKMKNPMQARIVTKNNRITEINVITGGTDINQTATNSTGQSVLAVRPKRPPMKKKSK